MALSKKERTASVQKSLETREKFPISYFDSRKYIQHNLSLGDGLGPILAFMDSLPADKTKVAVRRTFEDGEYSVAHADYLLGDWGAMVGFEVHRWENDRIVEHWDNLQAMPSSTNPSGRTMTDGTESIDDPHLRRENKMLVERFTTDVLIRGETAALRTFFDGDRLIQHSPGYGDGVALLLDQLAAWRTGERTYERLHKVLGEGSLALTFVEGRLGPQPTAFYDLYRIAQGKIAEHWDVIEAIPARDHWQNDNGKF